MEAVKKLPMISFELKNSPEPTSFHNLKQCIAEYYHEDPESYAKEFRELEQLRGLAVRPRVDFECCSTVKRYYSQLHSLQNRFPLSSENELLDFAWKDLYSGSMWRSSNIKYEMASILYNIAALHSQLGIEEGRSDPESMKIACTHFQCAAWAFGEMKAQYPNVLKGDLAVELMIFMQQISFGQAQECILEKSLADNRKAAIIAKVTAQVISFYNAALSALFSQNEDGTIQDLVGSKLYKEWLKYIKFKTSYLSSILFLYQGMNSEEQRKMGERVTLYNAACEKLEEAKKESKGMNKIDVINEALTFVTDIVEGKRKNAKQENEFIYHESIPDISTISAVQGANLVQGIPFDVTDPQVIGDDVFKRLVPMKTHEHLSVYSEEKANILRSLGSKIDERDAELASFMGSLNTESLNAMGQSQERLPQGLVDRCAELSAKPTAISDLIDSMSNLADICCDVEVTLKDIKSILDDEAKQEQNYQKQMSLGKRPTGHMAELSREFTKYFEAHNKAGESNDTLRKAMELHVNNLKILAQPLSALQSQVPQADPIDDVTRKELKVLLDKVEEMKGQRDGLFNELREQILNKDDITSQLIAHGDRDVEELFKKELKKYAQSVNIIEQNLVAQGNILKALTDTYAKHAMTLKSFNDTKIKREQFYSSLVASFDVYEDLLSKSAKGLDFYKKLHGNVQKLMSRMKAARDVQEEERQQLMKNAMPKAQPVDSMKSIDSSFKNMMASVPSSGGGGPKLKDYLKSGMVPGMGGLRDDLTKLPAIRPNPVGQENIPTSNPATCPSMNYTPTNYRNHHVYPGSDNHAYSNQQMPYYPTNDQHSAHSGSASLSSSSTSLNNDYYAQASSYGMNNNQGYVNPMYQSPAPQNYQDMSGYSQVDASSMTNNYSNPNSYQQPMAVNQPTGMSQYGTYGGTFAQQPQTAPVSQPYDYYKNQNPSVQQPSVSSSNISNGQQNMSYNTIASNQSYMNPTGIAQQPPTDPAPAMYQNQYQMPQQYPAAQSPVQPQQHHPVAQSPSNSQYSNVQQQYQSPPVAASPAPVQQQYQNPSVAASPAPAQQYQSPSVAASPAPAQQQYQSPPVAASPAPVQQHYQSPPVAASPAPAQQPTVAFQNQQSTTPNASQAPDQYSSTGYTQNFQQPQTSFNHGQSLGQHAFNGNQNSQDYANQQNYYNTPQAYMPNQYGQYDNQYSQQNYSCYTPTVNSKSSYMTANDSQMAQSHTTQSTNYEEVTEIIGHAQAQAIAESVHHQPYAIPTNSAATTSTSMNNASMRSTNSQEQVVVSPIEKQAPPPPKPVAVKSDTLDLLSGIDFTMTNPTIDNVPTLMPVSVLKPAEESPKKVLVPQSPVAPTAPVKLNDDLADLDFNSLSTTVTPEPLKPREASKHKSNEDPFDHGSVLKHFHKEVESLEKFMETLTVKTLNGVTPLANKWKELQDLLVKDEAKRSVSVARLFPDKNRSTDCLPYDHARVMLPTSTDNYINAVFVKNCGPVDFILTQTPMPNTVNDYWEMVWSQKSNTLVCLHSANELLDPFWPQNVCEEKSYGEITVTLSKQFDFSHCQEKVLKVVKHGSDVTMNVSLLQIKAWKKSSAENILDIANNVVTSFKQQNRDDQQHPSIVINCISGGAERSGLLTLGISSIYATQMSKPTLLNVVDHWFRICSQRKGALEDEHFIQLSLDVVLNNAHRILNKRGIMTSYQMKNADRLSAAAETEKSVKDTGLDSLDPFWKFK